MLSKKMESTQKWLGYRPQHPNIEFQKLYCVAKCFALEIFIKVEDNHFEQLCMTDKI